MVLAAHMAHSRRVDRRVRLGHRAVFGHSPLLCMVRAHSGELRGALRPRPPEIAERALRGMQTAAFLEHQPYLFESPDFPPSAPLRSPCQRAAPLPDAARF